MPAVTARPPSLMLEERALRPGSRALIPNDNDPADVPPATVGPPEARPGDPDGLVIDMSGDPPSRPPAVWSSPWSGWPGEWMTPAWNSRFEELVDTAWNCLDLNSSILSTMPPYLTRADGIIPSTSWLTNPDPDLYTSWDEFAKQLWWDYQMGEAFVLCTARYADDFPARFHVIEPWLVDVEMVDGRREYRIGTLDPGRDLLHIRYKSTTSNPRGTGPLEAGRNRLVAAGLLQRYALSVIEQGGVPYYVIKHPGELTATQIGDLQQQWWVSRTSRLGMPAILSGGIEIEELQISPEDMALLDLSKYVDSRIAVSLGVPPFLAGLPSGGDSMTYSNVNSIFDYHWRAGLRPKASPVVKAVSGWALPRGTNLEVNRDEYVRADPYTRAQTWEILIRIGVLTPEDVQQIERYAISGGDTSALETRPAVGAMR